MPSKAGSMRKTTPFSRTRLPGGMPNPVIVECIRQGKTASYEEIRNRTDFGLQLLSWSFDICL